MRQMASGFVTLGARGCAQQARGRRAAKACWMSSAAASSSSVPTQTEAGAAEKMAAGRAILALDAETFPILRQTVHDEETKLVYLDSAATSQKPQVVLDALMSFYEMDNSNVHRGAHSLSARATESFERARTRVAQLINAPARDQVVFTRNATEAINLVAYAWGLANLRSGDQIVLSVMEHHSNLVPWQIIAQRTGAELKHVGLTHDQRYDLEHLRRIVTEGGNKIKLVAASHVSNVLGCVNPVAEIAALARANGSLVLVDACQSVPHMRVDVSALDCDFLVASGHKMCAPSGIGFLYAKRELLEAMPPYMGGGEMIDEVFLDRSTWAMLPHKFEAGTPAIAEAVGLGAAVDYLESLGMDRVHDFEAELAAYLYEQLAAFEEVTIYGPPPGAGSPRAALCSFNVAGVHASDLATMIDLDGVAIRSGHHCTQPLHRLLGIDASARASLYVYNSSADVDAFIVALRKAVELLGGSLTPSATPTP